LLKHIRPEGGGVPDLKKICVIDGQGGGIGATLIKSIQARFRDQVEILALGTNAIATSQMMKAGANRGASGENAIARTVADTDLILGPIAITWANAMLGEVTPRMAEAVTSSRAPKILLPLSQEDVTLVGIATEPLPHMVQQVVEITLRQKLAIDAPPLERKPLAGVEASQKRASHAPKGSRRS
jgi:hypothetical protein